MAIKAETTFFLKDQLFNTRTVAELSSALSKATPQVNQRKFEQDILNKFPELELKARIDWMVTVLAQHLPGKFELALPILEDLLPPPLDPNKSDDDFGDFIWTVPGEYVARFGCTKPHLAMSLAFLKKSTMRFTAENSIRPFLRTFPKETMTFVRRCAKDKNYHVRRLASEGIRPFLPWAERANVEPDEIFEVMELLKHDRTRYVTRSVANTMNDLSKIEPHKVIAALARWQDKDASEIEWITKHALRTLIKQDHAGALSLLGYPTKPEFKLTNVQTNIQVQVGDDLVYQCSIKSNAQQNLKIALRVYYLKANGSHSVRVFAVKDLQTKAGDVIDVRKKISFRPITTRTLYLGEHHVEIVVNGIVRGKKTFELR